MLQKVHTPEMDEVVEERRGVEGGECVRTEAGERGRHDLLTQERLRVWGHVREVVSDHKNLDNCAVGVEQRLEKHMYNPSFTLTCIHIYTSK